MEDLFGFLLFIAFLGFSLVGKLIKRKPAGEETGRERPRQQWPGPVAPPGLPGRPRPATPRQTLRPVQQPSRPPQPTTPRRDADDHGEGVSIEGVSIEGVSVEGPAVGENVRSELARFGQETSRRAKSGIGGDQPRLQHFQPHLNRLKTALHAPQAEAVAGEAPDAVFGLDDALADPQAVARAFVLAEVLGKPKALRAATRR